jgi:hypothetical protein
MIRVSTTQPSLVELRKSLNEANNSLEDAQKALNAARIEYVKATEVSGQIARRDAASSQVVAAQVVYDEAFSRRYAAFRALQESNSPESND